MATATTKPRTLEQNSKFHTLLIQRKLDREEKQELVKLYTGGRSVSSKEMTMDEMAEAIKFLEGEQEASVKKMRSKIINIARDIFELRPADTWSQDHYDKLNVFLVNKFKKGLHKLSHEELRNAVTAMEKWRDSAMKSMLNNLLNA